MKLSITNRKNFIESFLSPLEILNSMCCVSIESNRIHSTCSSPDNTLVLHIQTDCVSDEARDISLPDLKRLSGALDTSKAQDIVLTVDKNNIKYNDGSCKFTYHLLEDAMIKKPQINIDKINALDYDTSFKSKDVYDIFKGMSFTPDTKKAYIYTEDGMVKCELGDRSRDNVDSFSVTLVNGYNGDDITNPIPVNVDIFKLLNIKRNMTTEWSINIQRSVFRVCMQTENCKLMYVFSGLSK